MVDVVIVVVVVMLASCPCCDVDVHQTDKALRGLIKELRRKSRGCNGNGSCDWEGLHSRGT